MRTAFLIFALALVLFATWREFKPTPSDQQDLSGVTINTATLDKKQLLVLEANQDTSTMFTAEEIDWLTSNNYGPLVQSVDPIQRMSLKQFIADQKREDILLTRFEDSLRIVYPELGSDRPK